MLTSDSGLNSPPELSSFYSSSAWWMGKHEWWTPKSLSLVQCGCVAPRTWMWCIIFHSTAECWDKWGVTSQLPDPVLQRHIWSGTSVGQLGLSLLAQRFSQEREQLHSAWLEAPSAVKFLLIAESLCACVCSVISVVPDFLRCYGL